MSDIDWDELFGPENQVNVESFESIPGLKLAREAITHEEQMKLINAIVNNKYFHDNVDQAMCFGTLPDHFAWLETWVQTTCPELFPEPIVCRKPLFDQAIINLYHKGK